MRLRSKLFYGYLLSLIVYSGFVLLPAPSPLVLHQFHVSVLGLRIIDVTIILILAAIWYAGFYGYDRLSTYSRLIKGDKDGVQVDRLTKGIFLLVIWLPVSSVTSAILNYIAMKHTGFLPAAAIIENYISLLFPLAAFSFIGLGARGLSELVKQRPKYSVTNLMTLVLVYVGIIYFRLVATTHHRSEVYHMSIWLIALTLVAPYIYMWFVGARAAYDIYRYHQKVDGIVYRRSWRLLGLGLVWLIFLSVGLQYLTTLSSRLSSLSIYWLLAIIYSILLVLSVGFVLIALGARKLQKIEEA